MRITDQQKEAFIDAYTKALITSWSSEEYAAKLESDPRAAFAEAGLELPADATIEVVRNLGERTTPDGDPSEASTESQGGSLDLQVNLYEKGLETGHYEFHMPETPQVDTSELSLDELADVAGGGNIYCCCCPCCCC